MAWIESHQELARHPKTIKLARILSISRPCAVGHLHFLWWWAVDYAQDGNLSDFDSEVVADGAGWTGDSMEFLNALVSAGFVDPDLRIHDWDQYAGRLMQKRQEAVKRVQKWRENNKSITNADVIRNVRVGYNAQYSTNSTEQTEQTHDSRARVLDSFDGLPNQDYQWQIDLARDKAYKAGYDKEEVESALLEIKNKGKPITRLDSYLIAMLKGNRELIANGKAPPKGVVVPKEYKDLGRYLK